MLQDLRFALRTLAGQPSFAVVAVVTLALGIGATSAIFTAVNAVLLRSLPFPDPGELYSLRTEMTDGRVTGGLISPAEVTHLNGMPEAVHRASAAFRYELSVVDQTGTPVKALGYGVTEHFFDVFAIPMALGRGFTPDEHVSGAPDSIVLSHRAWQTLFGGRADILGRSIPVEGGTNTVVGVAPEGFNFPGGADAWFNLKVSRTMTGHVAEAMSAFAMV